jgi:hypothetical protein
MTSSVVRFARLIWEGIEARLLREPSRFHSSPRTLSL